VGKDHKHHTYTRIQFVRDELCVPRQTAADYLEQLVEKGFPEKHKPGRSNYHINTALVALFSSSQQNLEVPSARINGSDMVWLQAHQQGGVVQHLHLASGTARADWHHPARPARVRRTSLSSSRCSGSVGERLNSGLRCS